MKSTFLLIKYSVPTILIEWTNLLRIKSVNVKFSKYQKQVSCKKVFLKFLQNSLKNIKNICDAVFNLKFQTKRSITLLKRDFSTYTFLRISQKYTYLRTFILKNADRLLLLKHLPKMKIAAPDKCLVLTKNFWKKTP